MIRQLLIGVAAGIASGLLFLALASGPAGAFVFFYLAPLPLLIAGLGWGWLTGVIAALAGTVTIFAGIGPAIGILFLTSCAAPTAWISRLANLARPVDETDPNSPLEWYPSGRLLAWMAGGGGALVLVGMLMISGSLTELTRVLTEHIDAALRAAGNEFALPEGMDSANLAGVLATLMPPAAAGSWTLMMAVNYWLARRVTLASGASQRPITPFRELRMPRVAGLALGGFLVLTFLPGLIGLAGTLFVAAFSVAFMIQGLSYLHHATHGWSSQGPVLFIVYAALVLFGWPGVVLIFVGLFDTFFDIRKSGGQAPPSPPSTTSNHGD